MDQEAGNAYKLRHLLAALPKFIPRAPARKFQNDFPQVLASRAVKHWGWTKQANL